MDAGTALENQQKAVVLQSQSYTTSFGPCILHNTNNQVCYQICLITHFEIF